LLLQNSLLLWQNWLLSWQNSLLLTQFTFVNTNFTLSTLSNSFSHFYVSWSLISWTICIQLKTHNENRLSLEYTRKYYSICPWKTLHRCSNTFIQIFVFNRRQKVDIVTCHPSCRNIFKCSRPRQVYACMMSDYNCYCLRHT
jgi:hypothetical protein